MERKIYKQVLILISVREEELKDNAMVNVTKIILCHNEEMLKVIVLLHEIKYMFITQVSLAIVVGATGVFLVLLVAVMTLAFWR